MLAAKDATYLDDSNIIFGISVNGDNRAYPKRILAWHEMFVDSIGGVPLVGVYCTLCGSMILYETSVKNTVHQMGTSGFLYRSNKLMYDQDTQSLWNTLWGRPVIGPLVDTGIRLERRSVVTTSWGEWKKRHPDTTVLSLNTGYQRNYDEGVAYKDYFSTDRLMFAVPNLDNRLKNKEEVLGIFDADSDRAFSFSVEYLSEHPLLQSTLAERHIVIVTDDGGASRVYANNDIKFEQWDGNSTLTDSEGNNWILSEDTLIGPNHMTLPRISAHRAFWFGWYAAFPDTTLVH